MGIPRQSLGTSRISPLLVSQTEPYLEQYYNSDRPNNTRWQWQVCDRLEQSIILPSLNLELPMNEIYRRISF